MIRGPLLYMLTPEHQVIGTYDILEYTDWMHTHLAEIVLAQTQLGACRISTVFLGVSVDAALSGEPVDLFETMIFCDDDDNPHDLRRWRYATYAEALEGHQARVKYLMGAGQ